MELRLMKNAVTTREEMQNERSDGVECSAIERDRWVSSHCSKRRIDLWALPFRRQSPVLRWYCYSAKINCSLFDTTEGLVYVVLFADCYAHNVTDGEALVMYRNNHEPNWNFAEGEQARALMPDEFLCRTDNLTFIEQNQTLLYATVL